MGIRSELRRVYRVTGFAGLTASMLTVYRGHDRLTAPDRRADLREKYVHAWSTGMLSLFDVEVVREGEDVPPGGALVVANHRSTIDIGIMLQTFGGHIVSRDDLANWPLVGAAARAVGTVFVDRKSASSGVTAIRGMARLLEEGKVVSVFPEGTTFSGDEVRPFHKGAFTAARMADCNVVPVGLAYSGNASFVNETFVEHLARMAATKHTRVGVVVGAPFKATRNAARAAEEARERVAELVARARVLAGP